MKHRSSCIAVVLAMFTLVEAYAQQPFIGVEAGSDTVHWYMGTPVEISLLVVPARGTVSLSGNATITPIDAERGRYRATISNPEEGLNEVCVTVEQNGKKMSHCIPVVVEQAELATGIERWAGMRAMIGRKYNPSSEWKSQNIPAAHYQTYVEIDGRIVFDRSGTSFRNEDLPDAMVVTEKMKEIHTTVYWKPNGTPDRAQWVALVTNSGPSSRREFEIAYPAPEQTEGFEFDWYITPRSLKSEFGPIVLVQNLGQGRQVGVQAMASCQECAESGVNPQLIQSDDLRWTLAMTLDTTKLNWRMNGKRLDVGLNLSGRGGASGFGVATVVLHYNPMQWPGGSVSVDSIEAGGMSEESVSVEDTSPRLSSGEVIHSLRPFTGKKVVIFRIDGELKYSIRRQMEAEDSVDVKKIEAICHTIFDEPVADCFNSILRYASSARTGHGKNYPALKLLMAQDQWADPEAIDDAQLQTALAMILAVKARRDARPKEFYMVTTQEEKPQIIGLVWANLNETTGQPMPVRIFSGSALDLGLQDFGPDAIAKLPELLQFAIKDEEPSLFRVWPEDKVR